MSKILYENKEALDRIPDDLRQKFTVESIFYQFTPISKGEAICIYITDFYSKTKNLIETLLYTKHKVICRYEDKEYTFRIPEDFKRTYHSDKDVIKNVTEYSELYQIYLDITNEKRARRKAFKDKQRTKYLLEVYENVPEDADNFIHTYAHYYDIYYPEDTTEVSELQRRETYWQIRYYIDNNIDYANPVTLDKPEIISFGDETYMEDFINKSIFQDKVLDYTE